MADRDSLPPPPDGFVIDGNISPPPGFVMDGTSPPMTKSEQVLHGLKLTGRLFGEGAAKIPAQAADLVAGAGNFVGNTIGRLDAALSNRAFVPQEYFPTGNTAYLESRYDQMVKPQNRLEEYGLEGGQMGMAALPGVGAGQLMTRSANPVTREVGRVLKESPGTQAVAGAAASAGSNAVEDFGGGPIAQGVAGLGAGMLTPVGATAAWRTAAGAGRTIAGVKDALTVSGQRKIVGNVLDEAAINSDRAKRNIADNEAFGPGISERTTGEASRDPGLLTLERAIRAKDSTGRFSQRVVESNEQRWRILDVLGGDDIGALKAQRKNTTTPMREAALTPDPDVNTQPIVQMIDGMLATPGVRGQKTVQAALNEFRDRIANAKTGQELYGIRKDINLALGGKLSGDRGDYKHASSQLISVKKAIDQQIENVAPGFRKYLNEYARLSKEIDQQEAIQGFRKARLAAPDPTTGRDVLSQASFRRMLERERENGVLTEDQLTVLQAIADDLDIGAAINAATVRPPGSDTARNLTVAHIIGRALGGKSDHPAIHTLIRPLRWLTAYSEEQVQGLLVEAMLDPGLARILMQEANPGQINRLNRALTEILGVSTVGTGAASVPDPQRGPEGA